MKRISSFDDLSTLRNTVASEGVLSPGKKRLKICCGTACRANHSLALVEEIGAAVRRQGVDLDVVTTGCQGLCQMGPIMTVEPQGYFYHGVRPERAEDIVTRSARDDKPVWDLLFRRFLGDKPALSIHDVPFYRKQQRIALRNNGRIDPTNIYHYLAVGGYRALEKALSKMTPQQVLDEVKSANLRGRGGAGFPAGVKWEHTKKASASVKLVIANGDEGDPGAFMDRSIMEGDPHGLLEGMLLCAYAIGAHQGIIYVRNEYPLAVRHLRIAIQQASDLGLLGRDILGTGFDFTVQVREGAGALRPSKASAGSRGRDLRDSPNPGAGRGDFPRISTISRHTPVCPPLSKRALCGSSRRGRHLRRGRRCSH